LRVLAFYRPEFLWALLFLGAILALHLLRRPRTRNLDVATLRFFQTSVVHASRMRSLRKWLQLLTRLAAAAAIIALFAAPFNRRDRFSMLRDPHLTIFTWIDRTPGMSYTENGSTLLDRSSALLDSLTKACASTVRRLDYDEGRGDFMPYNPASPPPSVVRHGGAHLDAVLRAFDRDRADYSLPLLLLCGDFHQSTTANLDSLLRMRSGATFPPLLCAAVTPRSPWNYAVLSAELRDRSGTPEVHAVIAARGRTMDSAELTVTVAGVRCGTGRISLAAGDSAPVDLELPAAGREGGCVTIAADDPLSFDNTRWFTSQSHASRVIVVGDSEKNYPVAAALSAASQNHWNPVTAATGETATYDDLDSADVIVLNGLDEPSSPLEALRQGRAFANKIVLLALGGGDREFAQSASFLSRMLPPTTRLTIRADTAPVSVLLPDTISELWRGFPRIRTSEAAVYRYVEGLPGTVLLRLTTGAPLVSRFVDRDGRTWILVATPIGITDANNLCETGFFVPCLDRILRYAATDRVPAAEPWIAGTPRRNPYYGTGKGAAVSKGDGTPLPRWQSQPMVLFPEPGLYTITPDGEPAFRLAVNSDPAEGRLDYALPSIPGAGRTKMSVLTDEELLRVAHDHGRLPSSLPWIVLCLLLVAEILLWERPSQETFGKTGG
jgi:hypothetical protein